jgi:hypothetical protein
MLFSYLLPLLRVCFALTGVLYRLWLAAPQDIHAFIQVTAIARKVCIVMQCRYERTYTSMDIDLH